MSKDGKEIDRGCTDIICCLIFLVFLIGYMVIGFLAYYNGDPRLLLHAQDSEGNLCGIDNREWGGLNMENKENLFMFDITKCTQISGFEICPTQKVCVEECPSSYWTYVADLGKSKDDIAYDKYICQNGIDPSEEEDGDPTDLISKDKCASYYMDSFSLFGYCVPKVLEDIYDHGKDLVVEDEDGEMTTDGYPMKDDQGNNVTFESLVDGGSALTVIMGATEKAASFFQDIYNAKYIICLFLGVALLATLLSILLLQFFAKILVWTLILVVTIASGLLAAFFWYEFKWRYDESIESGADPEEFKMTTNLAYYSDLYTTYFILAIITTVLFAILLFTLLFLFNRVRLAVALIVEGSKCVLDNLTTLLLPGATWILLFCVLGYAISVAVFLAAFGIEIQNVNTTSIETCDNSTGTCLKEQFKSCYVNATDAQAVAAGSNCFLMNYVSGEYVKFMHLYNVLGGLWLIFFVIGAIQLIQAGVYADWYWRQGDTAILPITRSIYRTFRYHTGSVAFGSFLIATVTLVRLILEYIDQKLKTQDTSDMAKFVLKCVKCFVYCLEKAVKVINKNAYIVIACYGKNFCSAATEALRLLVENCVRVVVLNTITEALLFVCQLGLVIGMGFLSYFAITKDWLGTYYSSAELTYYFAPIIVIVLGTWVIAKLFYDVYDMAIDTLFMCVLEDLEHFDGSEAKPYHMSKDLQKLLVKRDAYNVGDHELDETTLAD